MANSTTTHAIVIEFTPAGAPETVQAVGAVGGSMVHMGEGAGKMSQTVGAALSRTDRDVAHAASVAAASTRTVRAAAGDEQQALRLVAQSAASAEAASESTTQATRGLAKGAGQAAEALRGEGEQAAKTGTSLTHLVDGSHKATSAAREQATAWAQLGAAMEKAEKAGEHQQRVGTQLQGIGRGMSMGITAPLVAGAAAVTHFSNEFGTQLTQVETLAGVAREQVAAWRQEVLDTAVDVGKMPGEMAKGLVAVTSAGIRGAETMGTLQDAAMAARIGLGETNDIARVSAAAQAAWREEALSSREATELLYGTALAGNFPVDQLAGSLGRVLPIASVLGVKFDEVGAFIATFTKINGNAAESVTYLTSLLGSIARPTEQSEKVLRAFGLSSAGLRKELQEKGLVAVMEHLIRVTGGSVQALSAVIPPMEGLTGVLGTAGLQGDILTGVLDEVRGAVGKLPEAFNRAMEDPGAKFEQAAAQATVMAIAIGDGVAPALVKAMEAGKPVIDFAQDAAKWFSELDDEWQQTIVILGAEAAALGPLLYLGGQALVMYREWKVASVLLNADLLKLVGSQGAAATASTGQAAAAAAAATATTAQAGASTAAGGAATGLAVAEGEAAAALGVEAAAAGTAAVATTELAVAETAAGAAAATLTGVLMTGGVILAVGAVALAFRALGKDARDSADLMEEVARQSEETADRVIASIRGMNDQTLTAGMAVRRGAFAALAQQEQSLRDRRAAVAAEGPTLFERAFDVPEGHRAVDARVREISEQIITIKAARSRLAREYVAMRTDVGRRDAEAEDSDAAKRKADQRRRAAEAERLAAAALADKGRAGPHHAPDQRGLPGTSISVLGQGSGAMDALLGEYEQRADQLAKVQADLAVAGQALSNLPAGSAAFVKQNDDVARLREQLTLLVQQLDAARAGFNALSQAKGGATVDAGGRLMAGARWGDVRTTTSTTDSATLSLASTQLTQLFARSTQGAFLGSSQADRSQTQSHESELRAVASQGAGWNQLSYQQQVWAGSKESYQRMVAETHAGSLQLSAAADTSVRALGDMAQAAIMGTADMKEVVIAGFADIVQSALPASINPIFGSLIGVGAGILSAFARKDREKEDRVQKVSLEEYSQKALAQQQESQGPAHMTVQLIDGRTGMTTAEQNYELFRRERRDAVNRVPGSR